MDRPLVRVRALHRTKEDTALDLIRDAIVSGRFEPGRPLRQDELAEMFGMSATPVREALRKLVMMGLVEHLPHHGMRVARFSVRDAIDLYRILAVVEGLAGRMAIEQMTPSDRDRVAAEMRRLHDQMLAATGTGQRRRIVKLNGDFHMALYRAAGRRIEHLIHSLWVGFPWDLLAGSTNALEHGMADHLKVIRAVERGDADTVARAIEEHIDDLREAVQHLGAEETASR